MTIKPPMLHARGLRKDYGVSQRTTALADGTIDVTQGDFLAIMGPSGAGKSTLLNVLGLLDEASDGTYLIDGVSARDLSERDRDFMRASAFSFVFQASHVLPYETVEVNAALGLSIQGMPRHEREKRVQESLEQVGLAHRVGALARELSGGERQRLAIARAIATSPRILFADEPTGNLDEANTAGIMALLAQLNNTGVTIVLITHDDEVARCAKRIATLRDGRIDAKQVGNIEAPPSQSRPPAFPRRRGALRERAADALSVLTSRPARTLALVSAFLLGSAGLVAATGIGASAAQQVSDRLTASAMEQVYVANPETFTIEDLEDRRGLLSSLEGVTSVGLRINLEAADAKVSRFPPDVHGGGGLAFSGQTIGADSALLDILDAKTSPSNAGALLSATDSGQIALVGAEAAEALGVSGPSHQIWVRGRPLTVVGIIDGAGSSEFLANSVVIQAKALPNTLSEFTVQTEPGLPAAVAEAIPVALSPSNPGEVTVSTVADLRNLRMGVSGDLSTLVGAISLLLLGMAVLSAGTSMFLSVQARAQEIALRRALGLSRRGAVSMFMIEGMVIGLAGGLAGVAVGLLVVVAVAASQNWSAIMPMSSIYTGILAGALGGAVAAVAPAFRASLIEPAEAIR